MGSKQPEMTSLEEAFSFVRISSPESLESSYSICGSEPADTKKDKSEQSHELSVHSINGTMTSTLKSEHDAATADVEKSEKSQKTTSVLDLIDMMTNELSLCKKELLEFHTTLEQSLSSMQPVAKKTDLSVAVDEVRSEQTTALTSAESTSVVPNEKSVAHDETAPQVSPSVYQDSRATSVDDFSQLLAAENYDLEKYHSLDDIVPELKCPICGYMDDCDEQLLYHINEHSENRRQCPMCSLVFADEVSNEEYEKHVYTHFDDQQPKANRQDAGCERACPMCSLIFPIDVDQSHYEMHVQAHFDGYVPIPSSSSSSFVV